MTPSHEQNDLGGLIDDIQFFKKQKQLSKYLHVDDYTDVSKLEGFTLEKYIFVREKLCETEHAPNCTTCAGLISVAKHISENDFMRLSTALHMTSPGVNYKSKDAKRKLLQMPLAALQIWQRKGNVIFLVSKNNNLTLARSMLTRVDCKDSEGEENYMTKTCVKELLKAAESDAERERITFAITQASGHSNTKLRELYGFEDLKKRKERVENALREPKEVREALENIASIQEKALLRSFGIKFESDSFTDDDESEIDTDNTDCFLDSETTSNIIENPDNVIIGHAPCSIYNQTNTLSIYNNLDQVVEILRSCHLNWFECVEIIKEKMGDPTKELVHQFLKNLSEQIDQLKLNEHEQCLIKQSKQAFDAREKDESNISDVEEENIESEIEEDYVDWGATHDPLQDEGKEVIAKKVKSYRLKSKRKAARKIAEARFLRQKCKKSVGKILRECPDIGETIESFGRNAGVGADSWRGTGLLTFDRNRKLKKKATFAGIKEHVQKVYKRKFGYGTVVQLCVARNKRRQSAKRYKAVANVISRRARKGFTLRFNPDRHWSAALYRRLDALQLKDGTDILNINRDDQAGFRLDTLSTHSKHATLCIAEEQPLTTKTDYVNSYPSTLQTTSYNFSGTETTSEVCAGIVKAVPLHSKNPAQHAHDLNVIEAYDEIKPVFFNPVTGNRKSKICVRVDGGHDEGPAHQEVQFWCTNYHLRTASRTLILTTRESGSHNRNYRVELQNGCLAVAHTLNGSCLQSSNGKVNEDKLKENLSDAIDVYISRETLSFTFIRVPIVRLIKISERWLKYSLKAQLMM